MVLYTFIESAAGSVIRVSGLTRSASATSVAGIVQSQLMLSSRDPLLPSRCYGDQYCMLNQGALSALCVSK